MDVTTEVSGSVWEAVKTLSHLSPVLSGISARSAGCPLDLIARIVISSAEGGEAVSTS